MCTESEYVLPNKTNTGFPSKVLRKLLRPACRNAHQENQKLIKNGNTWYMALGG